MSEKTILQPQPGPQTQFLSCPADIAIYGGAAGGGKTYGLLLEAMRLFNFDGVNGAIFRREASQLTNPGSVWSESQKMYTQLGLVPNQTRMQYRFQHHSYLKFSGLQYDHDVLSWQGPQLDFLGFDELTQFTEYQFWYLQGRLRSASGLIKPYCRATCNPEDGWVFDLLKWWIDEKTGYPIPERSGVVRWLYRNDDIAFWTATKAQALAQIKSQGLDEKILPTSVAFIPATLNDNQILLHNDPNYYARLAAMPEDLRDRMLNGRWLFRPAGKLFKEKWFSHFVIEPRETEVTLITTDTASSTKTANDFTCFQVWKRKEGKIYLMDALHGKFTAQAQLTMLANMIVQHQAKYVSIERASTGFHLIDEIVKKTGVLVLQMTRTKDKYSRAHDIQAYVEQGYVAIDPNRPYYNPFVSEVCAFSPENKKKNQIHDDWVDPFIDAVYHLLVAKLDYKKDATSLDDIDLSPTFFKTGTI